MRHVLLWTCHWFTSVFCSSDLTKRKHDLSGCGFAWLFREASLFRTNVLFGVICLEGGDNTILRNSVTWARLHLRRLVTVLPLWETRRTQNLAFHSSLESIRAILETILWNLQHKTNKLFSRNYHNSYIMTDTRGTQTRVSFSQDHVIEYSNQLGYDAVPLDVCFPSFRRVLVPLSSGWSSPGKVDCLSLKVTITLS